MCFKFNVSPRKLPQVCRQETQDGARTNQHTRIYRHSNYPSDGSMSFKCVCVCHLFALMVHIWSVFLGLKRQCPVNSQPELALSLPLACVLTAYLIHTADRASARTCPSPVGGGWVCGTGRGFGMGATRPHFLGSESLAHSVRYWKVISSEGNVVGPLSWRVRLIQSTLTD